EYNNPNAKISKAEVSATTFRPTFIEFFSSSFCRREYKVKRLNGPVQAVGKRVCGEAGNA
ncbi:MAG: hypothetical protein WB368_05315, partial [Candidatus Sulfotelmatobacter sp.]